MSEHEWVDGRVTKGNYMRASALVSDYMELHKGENFDLDTICRQLQVTDREDRRNVSIVLARKVERGILEKVSKVYHYINVSFKEIDWVNAPEEDTLDIKFPYGVEDQSKFGFDGHVIISPGDIIVIAGQSNAGKTSWCQNFLWENMDFSPCTLMGNEYTGGKFKRRTSRMTWRDPINGDGKPKFELIERRNRWQDIIRPNNINIIDWINLTDNFYLIGAIIESIQEKLKRGICVISLQKAGENPHGRGGTFSADLSSLYLSMDFNRLTVVKAKEWRGYNPNGKIYGYDIVNQGTQFHNIRAINKCYKCKGSGFAQGGQCEECAGSGYIDDLKDIGGI